MKTRQNAIRAARKRARLTQQDVAAKLGVHNSAVCGWETGQYDPEPRNAIRLSRLLPGLTFEAIYSFPEQEAA